MIKDNCAILLVDSDSITSSLLVQQISDIPGMTVSACLTDGRQALEYLWTKPVDILITDIDLPGMDGLELVEYCNDHKLGCCTIIVSDGKDFGAVIRALQCGVSNYLPKSVPFPQLAEALENARALVRISRLYIRKHSPGPNSTNLGNAIRTTLRTGTFPEPWEDLIRGLLTVPSQLLRVSHQEPIFEARDFAFVTYHNLLSLLLPKTIVISLWSEQNSELYLLLSTKDCRRRTAESLNAWFDHVIDHKVTLVMEGSIESADQLISLAAKTQSRHKTIEAACEYIQNHLSEQLTRESLARQLYISPSYFGQMFKEVMGVRFSDYVTERRVAHAKACLAQNMPMKEIAAAIGFQNAKCFSKMFYKKTGYIPSRYRQALLLGAVKLKD